MLSIEKLVAGAEDYYLTMVARGGEESQARSERHKTELSS